ncbi:MFS transporter [Oceanibacterium hippocampi]|uniref:Major Facilitator Superfamily protein n=1 Tax=Oceanibacterium hippocampi TaxID=745714 RepID=A0A1Y5SQ76_9PROT|nr:MFS transporter [Oceanibacterium hippocampi]SLN45432.1 Major Facilitator Superfamily protein [Oceanibacterium hippocampi]
MTERRAILCLALGQTIFWAGTFYLFPALLLRWESALGWSKTTLTGAFAGAVVVSALCSPIAGRLIDRGRGPAMMALSGLAGALLIGSLALAGEVWQFVAIWLLIGIAMSGSLYEPCFALVTRASGELARRRITLITLIAGFAGTLSFPLNHVVAEWGGWPAAVLVFAALMALIGVPATWLGARYLEAGRPADADSLPLTAEEAAARPFLRRPAFWLLAAAFSLLVMTHSVILSHLLPILADRGLAVSQAVLAASMIGPMQVAGRLAVVAFERHIGTRSITVACFLAVVVGVLCLIGAVAVPFLVALFVLLHGSGFGVTSIMKPVTTRDILGSRNFGMMNGALAVPYLTAAALAPFVGSLIWEAGGYTLVLEVVTATALAGLVCYLLASRAPAVSGP